MTDQKFSGKKLPGLFEQYRLGHGQDYAVATPGPIKATPIPGMGTTSNADLSLLKPKLKSALSTERKFKK